MAHGVGGDLDRGRKSTPFFMSSKYDYRRDASDAVAGLRAWEHELDATGRGLCIFMGPYDAATAAATATTATATTAATSETTDAGDDATTRLERRLHAVSGRSLKVLERETFHFLLRALANADLGAAHRFWLWHEWILMVRAPFATSSVFNIANPFVIHAIRHSGSLDVLRWALARRILGGDASSFGTTPRKHCIVTELVNHIVLDSLASSTASSTSSTSSETTTTVSTSKTEASTAEATTTKWTHERVARELFRDTSGSDPREGPNFLGLLTEATALTCMSRGAFPVYWAWASWTENPEAYTRSVRDHRAVAAEGADAEGAADTEGAEGADDTEDAKGDTFVSTAQRPTSRLKRPGS